MLLKKARGIVFTCKYIKACQLYVMHFVSRKGKRHDFIHSHTYDLGVSLTKAGLPRVLPSYFRLRLQKGDTMIIKVVLTVLSLYRVLPYKGKVKISTITDPFKGSIPSDFPNFISIFLKTLKAPNFK